MNTNEMILLIVTCLLSLIVLCFVLYVICLKKSAKDVSENKSNKLEGIEMPPPEEAARMV